MIFRLTGETEPDVERLGGKACGLVRLLRHGFPVPEAWCLPASAYRAGQGRLTPGIEQALGRFWREFSALHPEDLLAVRSSATAEDLAGASFAGLYQTILGVRGEAALISAAQSGYRSLEGDGGRAYREAQGIGQDVALALVLQRMVRADVSGVMLTANPRRVFADEMAIDAAYGLGGAVASGRTQPDHIVLDRNTLQVREQFLGAKTVAAHYVADEGVRDRAVADEARAVRCLSDGQLQSLGRQGQQVARALGPRQELEWAFEGDRLYLLQLRPITGLPPENPRQIYSRKFADEFVTEYVVPFSRIFVDWINGPNFVEVAQFMGRKDLAAVRPVRIYNGYCYISGSWLADYLMAYPRFFRAPGRVVPDWFTPIWFQQVMAKPFKPGYLIGVILAPGRDKGRGPAPKTLAAIEVHCAMMDRVLAPKLTGDYTTLSDGQWWEWYEELDALGLAHFRIVRWGMTVHLVVFHGVLQFLLQRWAADDDGQLYLNVVSGLPTTRTALVNRDLWSLALLARGHPALREKLLLKTPHQTLRDEQAGATLFWQAFDAFLANHGHRGPGRSSIEPRWREQPDLVLGLLRAQLHGPRPPPDPAEMEQQSARRRVEAEDKALARAGKGLLGLLRRPILAKIVSLAQQFTVFRENQRYHQDFLLFQVRRLGMEMGRRLHAKGLLDAPEDGVFLYIEELRAMRGDAKVAEGFRALVAGRREHYHRWKNRVPATYLFDEVETEGDVVEGNPAPGAKAGGEAGFLGVSRGVYQGPVRVVVAMTGLADLVAGEILVTESIDPAWTAVFPLLGGLVTEMGGVLAHGALLAREYGIPAVMNVPNATGDYRTGERIEIDGAKGSIRQLEPR